MNIVRCDQDSPKNEAKERMQKLLAIVAELIATLREENALLRRGLPVSESLQSPRRQTLSHAYGRVWREVQENGWHADESVSVECEELFAAASELDGIARENARHLNAAVQASQRRIDAVMQAILDQERSNTPYSANGSNDPVRLPTRKSMQI